MGHRSTRPSSLPALRLHPKAPGWITFVVSCRRRGYKIVLLSVTAKSATATQLPSHTSLSVGVQLHTDLWGHLRNGISEGGAQRGKLKSVRNSGCQTHVQFCSARLTSAPQLSARDAEPPKGATADRAAESGWVPPEMYAPLPQSLAGERARQQ